MSERSGSSRIPTVRVTAPNPTPTRIGVYTSGDGLDVAVVARDAHAVDMCIFDEEGAETRYALMGPRTGVWHGHIPGFGAGTRYGFRVHGPWDPDGGKFFNSHKLLLDPYGRGIEGAVDLRPAVYAHCVDEELYPSEYPMRRSPLDSAPHMPRSVVVDPSFPIAPRPHTPWETTVIYEIHVKGFTKNMPGVPPRLRGTYAGLAHPASVSYLKDLGITAVELLPVHAKCDEPFLTERGLTNYWGYSTLSFFAPEPSYATAESRAGGAQAVVDEFRGMVSLLHQAGIEVILDVVYNHTCEGGDAGPSLSWRGLDSDLYYRHTTSRPVQTIDVTGTGNTVNVDHPKAIQMVLDSLRYWVRDMGVDGFRFDLAATLGRFATGFSPMHPLLIAMATDDDLAHVKLIAEPWDVGDGGYNVGGFPPLWSEWNGRYRDTVRDFWRGTPSTLGEFASRITGSSDLYQHSGRTPVASVNFVTAHDGFTLADLVSYDTKHNEANLEDNQDGANDNRSWNCGVEGPADDPVVLSLRKRQTRNFLATILFSQGVPMICHGDEMGRTQDGNNNAYCQDNEMTWVHWDLDEEDRELLDFTRTMVWLRRNHPVLRRRRFFSGAASHGGESELGEIEWLRPSGGRMTDQDWGTWYARAMTVFLNGDAIAEPDEQGHRVTDDSFLVLINASEEDITFTLPGPGLGKHWSEALDTAPAVDSQPHESLEAGAQVVVEARSMLFLTSAPVPVVS